MLSFDIFCRVIDNYGDIGVCWRLARQLSARADCGEIRLWVDDLASFARIARAVKTDAVIQAVEGVLVMRWSGDPDAGPRPIPADVVIEAFACSPPAGYLRRMSDRQLWINLEYLSAEPWVASCHGLPSLQPNGLRKFFFFPGFTPDTGGLLREPDLLARRDAWRNDAGARLELLEGLGVDSGWTGRLRDGARLVYVYCYPQAPLDALMAALAEGDRDTLVLLPEGIPPLGAPRPATAGRRRVESRTHRFVDQDVFDRLLWSSDLNIVRGEDSLVRALWAGRPMIWQPYRQADDAHLGKLEAWLEQSPFQGDTGALMRAWNRGDTDSVRSLLHALLHPGRIGEWECQAAAWCEALAARDDLATKLLDFCAESGQTS